MIRHLGTQDVGKPAVAHPGPAHHPFTLQAQRSRHDQREVTTLDAAAFEEQRYIKHDKPLAAAASPRDHPPFGAPHQRVEDPFKTAQRRRVAEYQRTQALAIDPAGRIANPRKRRLDRANRLPPGSQQPMDLRIGIE